MLQNSLIKRVCSTLCQQEILLVDDYIFNLYPLECMLEANFKINSTSVSCGATAIKLYQLKIQSECCRNMYRLVMTDIQMPEVDGFMVAERILATQKYWFSHIQKQSKIGRFKTQKNCEIIAVTAFTDEDTV